MEYRHLHAFVVLSEELHFGRAAGRLNIAQPALSQHIKALEQETGLPLFKRDRRNVELTYEGQQLLPQASLALSHFSQFRDHVRILKQGLKGHLTLGYVGSSILDPALSMLINCYRQHQPTMSITIEEHSVDGQISRLLNDQLDAALIRSPVPRIPELDYLDVVTRSMIAVLPAGHPRLKQPCLTLDELAEETFLIQQDPPGIGLGWTVIEACRRAGITPRQVMQTRDVSVACGLVSMGMGVAIVPETQRSILIPGVGYCELKDKQATTTLTLAWQRRRYHHALKDFIMFVKEVTGKNHY